MTTRARRMARLSPAVVFALVSAACLDLVVEPSDAPFAVTDLALENPTPKTGDALIVRYMEPLTVVGREVCITREIDGERASAPLFCADIGDQPSEQRERLTGFVFDELVTVIAEVWDEGRVHRSDGVRATARVSMDAPPLDTLDAVLDDENHVALSWTWPDETFTADGVVVARAEGAAPMAPDDDGATLVFEGDVEATNIVDDGVQDDTAYHYAAWVRDREGALIGPRTASVKTRIGGVTALEVTLDDAYGALLGTATLAWNDPPGSSDFVVDVVRAPAGASIAGPEDVAGTLVCSAVPKGQEGCADAAVTTGSLTYHAFVTTADDVRSSATTRTILAPDLRVSLFTATPTGAGAVLAWTLAGSATGVRIVRSSTGYALGPEDPIGTVIAETSTTTMVDTGLAAGETVYYVAFPTAAGAALTGPGRRTSTEPLAGAVEDLIVAPVYVGAAKNGHVEISWSQPATGSYSSARVLRTPTATPTSPDDGVVVCDEATTVCVDTGAPHGQNAIYAVWARDAFGTFGDTPAVDDIDVSDDLPPLAVVGLSASRSAMSGGTSTDRITLHYTLAGDDEVSHVEVWRGSEGAPPPAPGAFGAVLVAEDDDGEPGVGFDVPASEPFDLSVFVFDDAENASPPASIRVPSSTGLTLESWGGHLPPVSVYESDRADGRVVFYDATASLATACALVLDVGDDGPGPSDGSFAVELIGARELALDETTRVTLRCETPDGTLETSIVIWVADMAFGFALTVAPATPRDVAVGPGGVISGLVANQILRVDDEGAVLGVSGLEPLTGFGALPSPIGVAEHLEVFADGSVAVSAQGYVSGQNLPLGVSQGGAVLYEAHVVASAAIAPSVADIAVVDEGPHAGDVWIAGTVRATTTIRQGTTAAPGAATATVLAPFGSDDAFLARIGPSGPEVVVTGGSSGDDDVAGVVALPGGGAAFAGTLGDEPAALGDVIVESTGAYPPWGFVAFADDDGTVTAAEGLPLIDAVDAVVAHPGGGVVVAGRYDTLTQLVVARRGPGLAAAERWDRTASTCCLVDVAPGALFAQITGLAVDDDGDIWVVGYAYSGNVTFNGFESDVRDWPVSYAAGPAKRARSFVARYDPLGTLRFARAIVTPEGTDVRIDDGVGPSGPFLAVFASVKTPTVLDDLPPQVFGPSSLNATPTDLDPGQTGGVLMKLGPVPAPPLPPTSLDAALSASAPHDVTLSWTLPASESGARVIVVRTSGRMPAGPFDDEGTVLHDGVGVTSVVDDDPPADARVFYRAYVASAYPTYAGSEVVLVDVP